MRTNRGSGTDSSLHLCLFCISGRCSLGVAALGDHLYAVAGSDGWKCLSSTEKYDSVTQRWTFAAPLNINRRGLGLTEHNGKLVWLKKHRHICYEVRCLVGIRKERCLSVMAENFDVA